MFNTTPRMGLISGVWLAAAAAIVACTMAAGASLSISALLLVVCVVPMGVMLLLGFGAPPQTVAELLHAADTQKGGRS